AAFPVDPFDVGKESIPARCSSEWLLVGPDSSDPNWDPRRLNRPRQKRDVADLVVFSFEGKRFAAPESGEDRQPLVEHLGPPPQLQLLAKRREASLDCRSGAEAKGQAASGQGVERYRLARQLPGPPLG